MFCYFIIGQSVCSKEDIIVPQIINTVLSEYCNPPNRQHIALTFTCVALLGEFNQWIQYNASILGMYEQVGVVISFCECIFYLRNKNYRVVIDTIHWIYFFFWTWGRLAPQKIMLHLHSHIELFIFFIHTSVFFAERNQYIMMTVY